MPTFDQVLDDEARFRSTGAAVGGVDYRLTPATLSHPAVDATVDIVRCARADGRAGYWTDEVFAKERIVLHHTVGFLRGDIPTLTTPDRTVSVPYVIACDGTIYELWDPTKWAYHLGSGAVGGNTAGSRSAIGIELSSIGPLVPVGDALHNSYGTGGKNYGDVYCSSSQSEAFDEADYRGFTAFAAYPDAQLAALAKLVAYLCHTFGIPIDALPADQRSELLDSGTATAFKGIAAHVNFRTDKWDEGPWFPWDAFLTSVRARSGEVTTPAHDAASAWSPEASPAPPGATIDRHDQHMVQSGDTLGAIAAAHSTTVDELVALNGLASPDRIEVGQVLLLPHSDTYIVQRGDTLAAIATDLGVSVQALQTLNGITDPNRIDVGEQLAVPPHGT